MFCKKCGNVLNDGAVFCPKCGSKTDATDVSNNSQGLDSEKVQINPRVKAEKTGGKGGIGKIILIVAGVIVGLFVLLIVVGSMGSGSESSTASGENTAVSANAGGGGTDSADNDKKASNTTDEVSVNELIKLIDQAEKSLDEIDNDYTKLLEDGDKNTKYQAMAIIISANRDELKKLYDEEKQIEGLPDNVKKAGDTYFDIVYNARTYQTGLLEFMSKYMNIIYGVYNERPKLSDDYEGYYSWYQSYKKACDEVDNVPSCLQEPWNDWKDVIDCNANIADKLAYVAEIKKQRGVMDYLRYYSVINLADRYIVMEDRAFNGMNKAWGGENKFINKQRNTATELAKEIHSYSEMSDADKAAFEFKNDRSNIITLDYETVDTIYPSLYNTYESFVVVKTGCISGTKKIVVEMEIPGFTEKYKQSVDLDASYKTIYIKPQPLAGSLDLSTSKDAQINLSVYEKDGTTLIDSKTFPVTIKSRNDFVLYSSEFGEATNYNFLSLLTPHSEGIKELKRVAISEISNMTNGSIESIVGYQSDYVNVYIQAAGLQRAMYDMGIRYNMDGFSADANTQHIKTPDEVIANKSGLCIETTLVMASALQDAGFNTFIVLPTGHAQVAVELSPGTGEYYLIETTCLDSKSNNDQLFIEYANGLATVENPDDLNENWPIAYYSPEEWNQYIQNTNAYIIDCSDVGVLGLTPFAN